MKDQWGLALGLGVVERQAEAVVQQSGMLEYVWHDKVKATLAISSEALNEQHLNYLQHCIVFPLPIEASWVHAPCSAVTLSKGQELFKWISDSFSFMKKEITPIEITYAGTSSVRSRYTLSLSRPFSITSYSGLPKKLNCISFQVRRTREWHHKVWGFFELKASAGRRMEPKQH